MSMGTTKDLAIAPDVPAGDMSARDWFLRDSNWDDVRWTFAPTNLLEEEQRACILWDFRLPSGRRFTDPEYDSLRETCKRLIASVRARSLSTGLPQRARTAIGHFAHLRPLLHWMDKEGYRRFVELDCDAILRFRRAVGERRGRGGAYILPKTLTSLYEALASLYHLRDELGDGLLVDPFVGRSPRQLAGAYGAKDYGPYTPDSIAIPLVQQSIEFLEQGAIDVLRAREIYATEMASALERITSNGNCNRSVLEVLGTLTINTPRGPQRIFRIQDLKDLIEMLYAACFVVIAYLVGARVSEVLHLRAGCIQVLPTQGINGVTEIEVMAGTIFKHDRGYFGRHHEWVVPPVAIHAVSVLEALSAPNRERAGRSELWLRARTATRTMGATEWQRAPLSPSAVRVITPPIITQFLQRYARWLNLPPFEGKARRLTAREGRKTFARFAALRDRTCLYALAQHLGHRDRSVTDSGYSGTDHALEREIRTEVLERSVAAWEHMLSTPQLGGRAGHEILAKRPKFRGARMKMELKSYARTLVEAGLVLGVCDYGYCVYRQEYSACRGNSAGPNPVYREPSTCARCLNFAVSTPHRPYWVDQSQRCEALLNDAALPTQTLKIARERLEEARGVLASIDGSAKNRAHGYQAST
jgi:integrase